MKHITQPQLNDLLVRVLHLDKSKIDGEAYQRGVNGSSNEEIDARIIAFINNGLHSIIKGPNVLVVDRTRKFDVEAFGKGFTIWRGPSIGTGLIGGPEWEDTYSLRLKEIDFSQVLFHECRVRDGKYVTCDVMRQRLEEAGYILLDAHIASILLHEQDQATLNWLYKTLGFTFIPLLGTTLCRNGQQFYAHLWRSSGKWRYGVTLAQAKLSASIPVAVLPRSFRTFE